MKILEIEYYGVEERDTYAVNEDFVPRPPYDGWIEIEGPSEQIICSHGVKSLMVFDEELSDRTGG